MGRVKNLKLHMESQHGEESLPCEKCGTSFSSELLLKQHQQKVHTVDKSDLTCKECGKVYNSPLGLAQHVKKHAPPELGAYRCNTCGKGFKDQESFKTHLPAHPDRGPYPCHVCGKLSSLRSNLAQHIKRCHPGVQSPANAATNGVMFSLKETNSLLTSP